jgi:hypothetical protein
LYEKFMIFCDILYEFTYPQPEPGLKTWAPAPQKSDRSTGSGSATLKMGSPDLQEFPAARTQICMCAATER